MSDVHRRTAAEMLGLTDDQVTPEQRAAARGVNFGLLYGKPSEEAYVSIAKVTGADFAACPACGTTTHRKVGGAFTEVAPHNDTCTRRKP